MSLTREETILLNAPPMTTAIAKSITLPRVMKALNPPKKLNVSF